MWCERWRRERSFWVFCTETAYDVIIFKFVTLPLQAPVNKKDVDLQRLEFLQEKEDISLAPDMNGNADKSGKLNESFQNGGVADFTQL